MIGIVVGLVSSIIIFTFYRKDDKAVRLHKQNKLKEEKEKQALKKQQQQEMQKIKNDPIIKKRRQQKQKEFQQTFMNKLDEKDKEIIKEYLEKNKKEGKTDEEAVKQASAQTNLLAAFMFIVVLTLIFAVFVLSGVEVQQVKTGVFNFLEQFFPKIKEARANSSNEL